MSRFSAYYTLLMIVATLQDISGVCHDTFTVVCDHLNDYLNYETNTWTQLTVGNEDIPGNSTNINLDLYFLRDLQNLESLTLINQLKGIEEIGITRFRHKKLRFLNLYRNNLRVFHNYMFAGLSSLRELNLIDNSIVFCEGTVYDKGSFGSINLSRNKIRELKTGTFVNTRIRRFVIQHNQLSNIETKSLPKTLIILNLDNNELTYISDSALENLVNLKVLTISHNELSVIWNIAPFNKTVELLDFSFNNIKILQTDLRDFEKLKRLDLSFNKIKDFNFVSIIPKNNFKKKISLAFNLLTRLDVTYTNSDYNPTTSVTLVLFGNPWICKCLDEIELYLKEKRFKRTNCDLKLFNTGKLPVCVPQEHCFTTSALHPNQDYFDQFSKVVDNRSSLPCDVQRDMLDLSRERGEEGILGLPVAVRRVGNRTIPYS